MRGCGKSPVLNQGGSEVGLWVSGINADAAGVLLRIQREQGQTTKEKDRFHMKLSGEIILLDIWSARGVTNRAAKRGCPRLSTATRRLRNAFFSPIPDRGRPATRQK